MALKISPSLLKKKEETKETKETEVISTSAKLKGRLIEKNLIAAYKAYIEGIKSSGGKISNMLSGGHLLEGGYSLSLKASDRNCIKSPTTSRGCGKCFNTGFDYIMQDLTGDLTQRYKFYLSLDLSTDTKKATAYKMYQEIIEKACEKKISLQTKTEDHQYDSLLLYTFQFNVLLPIVQEMYKKYEASGIFLSCDHPMQGSLIGIDDKHIGYVQEPIGGLGGSSHSSRMHDLGKHIEARKTYEEACFAVGVKPDAPYLLDISTDVYKKNEEILLSRQKERKELLISDLHKKI